MPETDSAVHLQLDRKLQLRILQELSRVYPEELEPEEVFVDVSREERIATLYYLQEHGLASCQWIAASGLPLDATLARATARGLDFLADDGGLSALLGVVTVRLHEDTVKAMLVNRIAGSAEPETVKQQLIAEVRALPARATRELMQRALEAGMDRLPDIARWLETLRGS